mmetsp:Transcript_31987/g.44629  ORF Transcript_31987/g.44629 Transcript_31987/m.44629 type:complete len:213 (+) Transcript_31987:159-797(+)
MRRRHDVTARDGVLTRLRGGMQVKVVLVELGTLDQRSPGFSLECGHGRRAEGGVECPVAGFDGIEEGLVIGKQLLLDDRLNHTPRVLEHNVHWGRGRDTANLVMLIKILHHRHRALSEGAQALPDRRLVIVASPAGGAALQDASRHLVFVCVIEQNTLHVHCAAHDTLPPLQVIIVAWEAVDQESGAARLHHGFLEQRNRDLNRHNFSFHNV